MKGGLDFDGLDGILGTANLSGSSRRISLKWLLVGAGVIFALGLTARIALLEEGGPPGSPVPVAVAPEPAPAPAVGEAPAPPPAEVAETVENAPVAGAEAPLDVPSEELAPIPHAVAKAEPEVLEPPSPRQEPVQVVEPKVAKAPPHVEPAQPMAAKMERGPQTGAAEAQVFPARFYFNSAEPKAIDSRALSSLVSSLSHCGGTVVLTGHSCSLGDFEGQKEIALIRAKWVRNILAEAGVRRSSMRVQSMGGSQPIADNTTSAGRAENRRVVVECRNLVSISKESSK
jgi:outer membrane protein OmpA-like peptidoglycan-associated protein